VLHTSWQYVFGNERPKSNLNKGAGLDVSPAVRDYLGLNETDVTKWRFVEFTEVPRGPWSTLGENNTFVISDCKAGSELAQASKRTEGQWFSSRDSVRSGRQIACSVCSPAIQNRSSI
jgi:hypothetical protein